MSDLKSPISGTTTPSTNLSPRSKVRALLADLDSDSDSCKENESGLDYSREKLKGDPRRGVQLLASSSHLRNRLNEMATTEQRGTLGASSSENVILFQQSNSSLEETAYERVKRKLMLPGSPLADVDREDETSLTLPPAIGTDTEGDNHSFSGAKRKRPLDSRASTPIRMNSGSPGLSASGDDTSPKQAPHNSTQAVDSSSDLPAFSDTHKRLRALVAKKRAERQAQEKASQKDDESNALLDGLARNPTAEKAKKIRLMIESDSDGDRQASKKFTQESRPTRKASKKAIEEINRETQRMSRNMQLTHEARTKVKFTTQDLFAKFNFRQSAAEVAPQPLSCSATASSDLEEHSTPPSSPPSAGETPAKSEGVLAVTETRLQKGHRWQPGHQEEELPSLEEVLTQSVAQLERNPPPNSLTARLGQSKFGAITGPQPEDSDDDLEIVENIKPSRLAVFDRLPPTQKKDSQSIKTLKALAKVHFHENSRSTFKKSLTTSELHASLRRRAREQALVEKAEKIKALREKGVIIQTAEEKEKDQLELESLVEKARKEADELSKREREAARKNGTVDESHLPDSDNEDDDWDGEDEDDVDEQLSGSEDDLDHQLSGSEGANAMEDSSEESEEGDEERDGSREDGEGVEEGVGESKHRDAGRDENKNNSSSAAANFFNIEASEAGSDGDDEASDHEDHELLTPRLQTISRPSRRRKIVADDDDDDAVDQSENSKVDALPTPLAIEKFGFANVPSAPLGLTQVFAGTMSDSQTQPIDDHDWTISEPFPSMPSPEFRNSVPIAETEIDDVLVQDSQTQLEAGTMNPAVSAIFSPGPIESQLSEFPDPTQDMGFQLALPTHIMASYSTVDTVPLTNDLRPEEEAFRRNRRLVRGTKDVHVDEAETGRREYNSSDGADPLDAFTLMLERAAKPGGSDEFNKKASKARGMVEEQAEESEDEYAGLGGISDDESQGEIDDETKKMIDDESTEKIDEQALAALHAEKERADDEKRVEKLFKDINGGWRRKRGADLDFSDSDDDAAARRQAKQREFARMRKALLADEKLGKIAENPKQQAFLQAIEDRDEDDSIDLLNYTDESQMISQDSVVLPFTTDNAQRNVTTLENRTVSATGVPLNPRRTQGRSKPSSLAQIRTTLSELIGESESALAHQSLSPPSTSPCPSSDDETDKENSVEWISATPFDSPPSGSPTSPSKIMAPPSMIPTTSVNRRRTFPQPAQRTVIDRIALKRANSSMSNHASSRSTDGVLAKSNLAFHAPTLSRASSGFRRPSLLRRATTASSTSSSSNMSANAADGTGKTGIKMSAAPTRSSVNWYVRERELRARVDEVEKRHGERRERVGRLRMEKMGGVSGGLGGVGGGLFE